jgi:hypothetical protein
MYNLHPFQSRTEEVFFDMNGHEIKQEHIAEMKNAPFQKHLRAWIQTGPVGAIFLYSTGRNRIPVTEILDSTTLAELKLEMALATEHPWQTLTCHQTGLTVMTADKKVVRVNPRTNQLTDNFGWALFNEKSGLPIIFHEGDIITTDQKQQRIENAVLLDSMTVDGLLRTGVVFWIDSISTKFGTFDVPVLEASLGSAIRGEFVLMNGESTEGITNGIISYEVLRGMNFREFMDRVSASINGENGRPSTFQMILIVLGLIAVIILLSIVGPYIAPFLTILIMPFKMLAGSLKRRERNKDRD